MGSSPRGKKARKSLGRGESQRGLTCLGDAAQPQSGEPFSQKVTRGAGACGLLQPPFVCLRLADDGGNFTGYTKREVAKQLKIGSLGLY